MNPESQTGTTIEQDKNSQAIKAKALQQTLETVEHQVCNNEGACEVSWRPSLLRQFQVKKQSQ